MTNSPGESRAPEPIINPGASEAQLRDRSDEIIIRLGELGLEMTALTNELTAINEYLAKPTEIATTSADTPVELFSAVGRQAARTQEELEALASKNSAFPEKLQDIFAQSRTLFNSELLIREQRSDLRVGFIRLKKAKPPREMAVYDSREPDSWEKFVARHAQKIEWSDEDETRKCSYTIKYVRLANGQTEMVGYGYENKPKTVHYYIDHYGHRRSMCSNKVEVECAGLTIRRASMSTTSQNISAYEDVDVEKGTYRYSPGMGVSKNTLAYNPEEYRFEDKKHRGKDADEVLARIRVQMSFLPTVEQPGAKQEI